MAEYHTTYKGPEGRTTQWEDIQIKMGNMAPKPKPEKAPEWEGEQEQRKDAEWVKRMDKEQLSDAEDDFDDDRALKDLRCSLTLSRGGLCPAASSCMPTAGHRHAGIGA
jgi:hypothetical protein